MCVCACECARTCHFSLPGLKIVCCLDLFSVQAQISSKAIFTFGYNYLCDKGNSASISYKLQQILWVAGKSLYSGETILPGLNLPGFFKILKCGEGFVCLFVFAAPGTYASVNAVKRGLISHFVDFLSPLLCLLF